MTRTRRLTPFRIGAVVAVAALIVAMALSTRFVTPDELASIGPEKFDPAQTAEDLFADANKTIPASATPLPELLTGLQQDIAKTAEAHDASRPNETTYLFPVSGEATVVATQDQAVEVTVDGVPKTTPLSIASGPATNGAVLRDALGFKFGDASNQTTYQQVGDELKRLVQEQVQQGVGADLAPGAKVGFTGILSVTDTGMPQPASKPVQIQPLTLEKAR